MDYPKVVQDLCDRGQEQLERMEYLQAESSFVEAESLAWTNRDFDTIARVYLPLQECRRQRRQRCAEGVVQLDLIARGPDDRLDAQRIVDEYPHGQLLVAGWQSILPALEVRKIQAERGLYLETFLAAVHPRADALDIVIVPLTDEPIRDERIVLTESDLPRGPQRGSVQTFALVMSLWERLHRPFLDRADAQTDPMMKIDGYRKTIAVDYACELAHQKLSAIAAELSRRSPLKRARPL
jgi:hypothetical protein